MATTTSSVADEIRAGRTGLGLSQAALAGMAGCSIAFLGNLERGYVPARSEVIPRLLAAIDAYNDDE